MEKDYCDWSQDGDEDSDTWGTACGRMFSFNEGTPFDNGMKFCCYCGRPMSVTPLEWDAEKEETIYGARLLPRVPPINVRGKRQSPAAADCPNERVCVWPDGDWCYECELSEMGHKSDDYQFFFMDDEI